MQLLCNYVTTTDYKYHQRRVPTIIHSPREYNNVDASFCCLRLNDKKERKQNLGEKKTEENWQLHLYIYIVNEMN